MQENRVVSSLGVAALATVIATIFGLGTNKIVAVYMGTDGIALIGFFRRIIGLIVPILSFGSTTAIVRLISLAPSSKQISQVIESVFNMFILQFFTILLIIFFFSKYLSIYLFGDALAGAHLTEVRVVLSMSYIIILHQSIISIISGGVNIKAVSVINIFTAFFTFIFAYPIISNLGDMGVALLSGSGGFAGLILGLIYLNFIYRDELSKISLSISNIKNISFPISSWLLMHSVLIAMVDISVYAIISRYYAMETLGIFNAVIMLESSIVMLLMSGMKMYYLPMLAKLKNTEERKIFVNKILLILIAVSFLSILFLITINKWILLILFSKEFVSGSEMLKIQAITILPQVFSWCYAVYLIHLGEFRRYLLVDVLWGVLLLTGVFFVASNGFPLVEISMVYIYASVISVALYIFHMYKVSNMDILSVYSIFLGVALFCIAILVYLIEANGLDIRKAIALLVSIILIILYFRRGYKENIGLS